jgi:hypothetical protein
MSLTTINYNNIKATKTRLKYGCTSPKSLNLNKIRGTNIVMNPEVQGKDLEFFE